MSDLRGRALELKRAGNRALARRDYEGSERNFRLLIQEAPDVLDGYLGLAKLLDRRHRQDEIVKLLEPQASRFDTAGFHRALGDAYRVIGAHGNRDAIARAIDVYDLYHGEQRDPVTLFYKGELLAEVGQLERAFEALRSSLALDPRSPTVRGAAKACARKLGRPELAKELPALERRG